MNFAPAPLERGAGLPNPGQPQIADVLGMSTSRDGQIVPCRLAKVNPHWNSQ